MNHKLLALYGLKFNPFSPELPTEAIFVPPKIENFCWRIEHAQIREGGFAMIHGDPGTGKSVVLRLLAQRLSTLSDVTVGAINHPQSNQPTSTGNWATSLAWPCVPPIAGAASRRCASAGSVTWRAAVFVRCC